MNAYDQPDPSDIPGTSDFAYAQEQMRRDEVIDDWAELAEHPAKKMACFARDLSGRYRVVVGDSTGVIVDGTLDLVHPTFFALGLDRATRTAITHALDKRGATVAVVIRDDNLATVFDILDKDETGVPPDPARWCWDRLSTIYFGDAA